MTDRDRHAPRRASNPGPADPPAGAAPPTAHQDSDPRGDGPPMSLSVATRSPVRPPADSPPFDRGRAWLSRLFAGDFAFPAVVPAAVPPAGRGPAEHDAVARALGCPDLFVVSADGPARERVIAELARATARTGRVLVLSPDPAAADRLTAAIADHGPPVVRALAADENPIRPAPAVTRNTSADRLGRIRREMDAEVAAAEARLARLAETAAQVEQARGLTARLAEVEPRRAELRARHGAIDAEVRAEADGTPAPTAFTATFDRLRADRDAATAPVRDKLAAAAADRAKAEAELAEVVRQMAEHAGRKSGFFARLFGGKAKPHDPADAEQHRRDLEREAKEQATREAGLRAELDATAARFAAEWDRLVAAEVAARRATVEAQLAPLDAEAEQLRHSIEGCSTAAGIDADPAAGAIDRAAAGFAAQRAAAEEQLAAARARLAEFTRDGPAVARRLLADIPVVVGTPGSLHSDPAFDGLPADAPPFALVVLDHAEELTEPDFVGLARFGDRWVLAAELPDDPRPPANGAPRGPRHARPSEPFLARLVRLLDREPLAAEADRLVCRLAHPTPEQRRAMTREPLADRPEVELRFVRGESGEPVLAEIVFPAGTTAADAKAFVARELGETLLRPCGDSERRHAADCLTVAWPAATGGSPVWIDLEPGVREHVAGAGAHAFTAAVSFDAGWDAERVEAWLASRLPAASPGRVAVLPRSNVPHPSRTVAAV